MTDPFYKAIPGGPILAEDWNDMQVKMRDELTARISAHTHTGATEGKKLTGDGLDPTSVLKVNQLDAAVSLSVKNIDVLGRLNTLDAQKLALTGGNITGALSVSGALGLGTTSPNKKLTVDYTGSTANHANMELRQPGNVSWGVALVVRTTGGVDGASILLRSRTKNWQLRGEMGATATGFQLTEDGGDAEYGSGAGTPRLHVSAGGAVGIGTTTPVARLDLQDVARSGTHPTAVKGLYVTGTFGDSSDGIEFRHTDGTQGIGFGRNTLYATGSSPNQDLNLQARGAGYVRARVDTNYMVLERTSSTVGKAIFLELYQGSRPTGDVFPSIRFHHTGRFWTRLESSNARLHFKQGDLTSDEYVDAAARTFYVGGEYPAPGCAEQVRMIRGFVNSTGGIRGAGFSARWVESGICDITFTKAFADAPIIVATQMYAGDYEKGGDTRDNAVVISSFTTRARVKTGGNTGSPVHRDFHFIVIGT